MILFINKILKPEHKTFINLLFYLRYISKTSLVKHYRF